MLLTNFLESESANADIKANYIEAISDPDRWFQVAEDLIGAAQLIGDASREQWRAPVGERPVPWVHDQFLMLAGFGLENLLKGAIISRLDAGERRQLRSSLRVPEVPMWTHELDDLWCILVGRLDDMVDDETQPGRYLVDANVIDTEQIRETLVEVQQFTKWRGRYPSPTQRNQMAIVIERYGEQHLVAGTGSHQLLAVQEVLQQINHAVRTPEQFNINLEGFEQ